MNDADLDGLTVIRAARLLKTRKISALELTRASLARIERLQPMLNAFITITADHALRQARRADREIAKGRYRGVLHGIPVSVKDLYEARGIRTTAGSLILAENVSTKTATTVNRLEEAGTVLLGKNNLHEWACGVSTDNPFFGTCHNPWRHGYIPGGSSGGSAAAVATNQGLGSLGSDTAGSIRIPAHMCGIVGHKPTYGLVPRTGIFPESWSFDHGGPMARTVEDTAVLLQAIAGHDAADRSSLQLRVPSFTRHLKKGVRGLRIGVPKRYFFEGVDPAVGRRVREAIAVLEGLGARLVSVDIPEAAIAMDCAFVIAWSEAAHYHRKWLRQRPQDYGADVQNLLQASSFYMATDYLQAQQVRTRIQAAFHNLFQKIDILATPACPLSATPHGVQEVQIRGRTVSVLNKGASFTSAANVTGEPSCSVPCGFTKSGLPVGLMLHGRAGDDATVLRTAYAYEQANEWHNALPPCR
ncbi:MAG: amidase [Pseudomonadota bacterium]|nr:amidase [Pseudomonadota bacterium]